MAKPACAGSISGDPSPPQGKLQSALLGGAGGGSTLLTTSFQLPQPHASARTPGGGERDGHFIISPQRHDGLAAVKTASLHCKVGLRRLILGDL